MGNMTFCTLQHPTFPVVGEEKKPKYKMLVFLISQNKISVCIVIIIFLFYISESHSCIIADRG